jgi:alkanesulfonate monooxygenase SsuD/methylene tetrahydromethanopterin reductase-like flavin-dependent oxidoreductase (luciferase family)
MRFGVQTVQQGVSFDVESIWTMDHLAPPSAGADPGEPCFESWTLLAAASQQTRRLRLGCLVSSNTFRHPALLAKMAATLDHASHGRLVLGLGAGWHEGEHRAFGLRLPTLRERQDRLEEAAALLRSVLDGRSPLSFRGVHYHLENARFEPRFVQRPAPPLLVGGNGERRTLRTAALYADVANLLGPISVVRDKLEVLSAHCEAVGRDFSSLEKTVHVPLFVHEDLRVVERVSELLAAHTGISPERVRAETPVGPAARVCEILARYAELGITGIVFPAPAPYDYVGFAQLSERVIAPLQVADA